MPSAQCLVPTLLGTWHSALSTFVSVSVRLTSGSKRYVVLRALLRISNLLDELIEMPWRVYEVDLVRIHNQQWRFVVPVKVVRIRLAELLQILRRDRFFVGSPALLNAP